MWIRDYKFIASGCVAAKRSVAGGGMQTFFPHQFVSLQTAEHMYYENYQLHHNDGTFTERFVHWSEIVAA